MNAAVRNEIVTPTVSAVTLDVKWLLLIKREENDVCVHMYLQHLSVFAWKQFEHFSLLFLGLAQKSISLFPGWLKSKGEPENEKQTFYISMKKYFHQPKVKSLGVLLVGSYFVVLVDWARIWDWTYPKVIYSFPIFFVGSLKRKIHPFPSNNSKYS